MLKNTYSHMTNLKATPTKTSTHKRWNDTIQRIRKKKYTLVVFVYWMWLRWSYEKIKWKDKTEYAICVQVVWTRRLDERVPVVCGW